MKNKKKSLIFLFLFFYKNIFSMEYNLPELPKEIHRLILEHLIKENREDIYLIFRKFKKRYPVCDLQTNSSSKDRPNVLYKPLDKKNEIYVTLRNIVNSSKYMTDFLIEILGKTQVLSNSDENRKIQSAIILNCQLWLTKYLNAIRNDKNYNKIINKNNCFGINPLHLAISLKNIDLVKILISYKAILNEIESDEIDPKTNKNAILEYPLDYAIMLYTHLNENNKLKEIITILHDNGAKLNPLNKISYQAFLKFDHILIDRSLDIANNIEVTTSKNVNLAKELLNLLQNKNKQVINEENNLFNKKIAISSFMVFILSIVILQYYYS